MQLQENLNRSLKKTKKERKTRIITWINTVSIWCIQRSQYSHISDNNIAETIFLVISFSHNKLMEAKFFSPVIITNTLLRVLML